MTCRAELVIVYLVVGIAKTEDVAWTWTRHCPISLNVWSSHADVKDLGTLIWVPASNYESRIQLLFMTHLWKHFGSRLDVRESTEFNAVSINQVSNLSGSILWSGCSSSPQYDNSVMHIVNLICCTIDNEAWWAGSCLTTKDLRESAAAMTPPLNLTAMMVVPIRSWRYGSKTGSCVCVYSIILKIFWI